MYIADLQMVNITLRILSRPDAAELPKVYRTLGTNWEERLLPSICNEVSRFFNYSHQRVIIQNIVWTQAWYIFASNLLAIIRFYRWGSLFRCRTLWKVKVAQFCYKKAAIVWSDTISLIYLPQLLLILIFNSGFLRILIIGRAFSSPVNKVYN